MNKTKIENLIHPNYKKIYTDIILIKYPSKISQCQKILEKNNFTFLDVIAIDEIIFGNSNTKLQFESRKHRSYDKQTIFEILDYQKKNKLNNSEVARYFKLSRNTLAGWKKVFI